MRDRAPLWLYGAAIVPALLVLLAVVLQPYVSALHLLQDPTTVIDAPAYVGLVSNLGVLLWCATAAIALFAGGLARNRFLTAAGLLSALFALDDLLQFHEWLGPRLFGLPQPGILAAYTLAAAAYAIGFHRAIARYGPGLFAIALLCLIASLALDLFVEPPTYDSRVAEDGAKFVGIACWAAFHIHAAWAIERGDG